MMRIRFKVQALRAVAALLASLASVSLAENTSDRARAWMSTNDIHMIVWSPSAEDDQIGTLSYIERGHVQNELGTCPMLIQCEVSNSGKFLAAGYHNKSIDSMFVIAGDSLEMSEVLSLKRQLTFIGDYVHLPELRGITLLQEQNIAILRVLDGLQGLRGEKWYRVDLNTRRVTNESYVDELIKDRPTSTSMGLLTRQLIDMPQSGCMAMLSSELLPSPEIQGDNSKYYREMWRLSIITDSLVELYNEQHVIGLAHGNGAGSAQMPVAIEADPSGVELDLKSSGQGVRRILIRVRREVGSGPHIVRMESYQ